MNNLQSLLNQITPIVKAYKKLSAVNHDKYNIFRVLNLQTDEVNLHSLFLAELLNPKGSHGKGSCFLKEFISISFSLNEKNFFDITTAQVQVEKFIGPISSDRTTGGRIDIIIEDQSGACIIIENKIYAGDQDKQLIRYHKYKGQRKGQIFYLTIDGKAPTKSSIGDLIAGQDFELLSYKNHIVDWLEKCHQLSSDLPALRETIKQYINLIKSFTGQTIFKEMINDIKAVVIQSQENFESAFRITTEFEAIKIKLLVPFWENVYKHLQEELGNDYKVVFTKEILEKGELYPKIWVNKIEFYDKWYCQFGLEALNGKSSWNPNKLYHGMWLDGNNTHVKKNGIAIRNLFDTKVRNSMWWLDFVTYSDLNFNNDVNTLKQILPNTPSSKELTETIVKSYSQYIKDKESLMEQIVEIALK